MIIILFNQCDPTFRNEIFFVNILLNQEDKINESNIFLANIYWRLFKDGIELINNATYKNYVRIEKDKNLNLQEKEGRPKRVNLHVKSVSKNHHPKHFSKDTLRMLMKLHVNNVNTNQHQKHFSRDM